MKLRNEQLNLRRPLSIAMVATTVFLSGCGTQLISRPPTPTPIPMPQVSTGSSSQRVAYSVERGSIINSVAYSGRVALDIEEDIYFRRGGQITTVHVQDGQVVTKDSMIAELDTEMLEIDLRLAENNLEVAELRLAEAQEQLGLIQRNALIDLEIAQLQLDTYLERIKDNPNLGTTLSQRELEGRVEKAEIALARTRAEVDPVLALSIERAKLNLQRARTFLLDARVSAPFDGEIRFISLPDEGERQVAARAYEPVARLIDPNSLTIEMNLTKEQLNTLSEGMPVTVVVLSRNGEMTLPATIGTLPIPFGNGTGPITRIALNDDPATLGLIEGSTVDVKIDLEAKENVLIAPVEALFGFSGQYYVRVQNGTEQQTIDVEVGLLNETHAEIVTGVTEGQVLVGR